jgi:hypothetical protein
VTRIPIAWLIFAAGALGGAHGCSSARYSGTTGPTLTFPQHFAEGEPIDGGPSPVASARTAPDGGREPAVHARARPTLPDPEPLKSNRHWDYVVSYEAGKLRVVSVTGRVFAKPVPTPRRLGRYAIELWIGHELVDRVRFDFPALAAEPPNPPGPKPLRDLPSFAKGAVVTARVLVPASPRATRALLVDRQSGSELLLPWPPDAPLPPIAVGTDAGAAPVPVEPSDAGAGSAD